MKTILSIIFLSLSLPLFSQDVTYNHDRVKQNQFTAMEAGYGSLDDWYYIVFHNSYKSYAHEKNKGSQRWNMPTIFNKTSMSVRMRKRR